MEKYGIIIVVITIFFIAEIVALTWLSAKQVLFFIINSLVVYLVI